MTSKDPFKDIENVDIPELEDESPEEELFTANEEDIHGDHTKAQMIDRSKQIIRTLKLQNDNLIMLSNLRKNYSWAIFCLSAFFLIVSMTIVILSAITICNGQPSECFSILDLSDDVLLMILGTNVTQVIGILFIVAKWLYPNNKAKTS